MPTVCVPPIPYGTTAVRPGWAELPAELRTAVAARLHSPVVWASTAQGGFTRGFAGVLDTAAGDRVFVKAASLADQRHLTDYYAREAAISAVLPGDLRVARPRWTLTVAGYYVICLDAIDGHLPALPWDPAELDATLTGYAAVAAGLATPPPELVALGLPELAEIARTDLCWWRDIADGREPRPAVSPTGPAAALAGPGLTGRLADLAALEARLPGYARTGAVIHCDLRVDNVLIDKAGAAWFCDWNWVCYGPAWFDLAGLLVTAYASGLDADAIFAAQPGARQAPPDALDAALAALSGHWLTRAAAGPSSGSPHLGAHQQWSGEVALGWLAERRGWS
nr:phosphotransferase [Micromonospora sp. DSM 115978]